MDKPICVVLDSNIWISARMLRTPLGAALLYSLRQLKGYLGLPEVVELEVENKIPEVGMEAAKAIEENFSTIGALTGAVSSFSVPSRLDLYNAVFSRFRELEPSLKRVAVSLPHAKAALSSAIKGIPPNNANREEFRDSLIWEAALELADSNSVYFVTLDKAFFRDRDPKKGLAIELLQECRSKGREIKAFYGLQSCLENLRKSVPPLNLQHILNLIEPEVKNEAQMAAAKENLNITSLITWHIEPFLTETDGTLALSFMLQYEVIDAPSGPHDRLVAGSLEARGSGFFNQSDDTIQDVNFDSIDLFFVDKEGRPRNPKIRYVLSAGFIGTPTTVTYTFKHPLTENE